jgi:hypothetical protein
MSPNAWRTVFVIYAGVGLAYLAVRGLLTLF